MTTQSRHRLLEALAAGTAANIVPGLLAGLSRQPTA
jgi:hypothetical protein